MTVHYDRYPEKRLGYTSDEQSKTKTKTVIVLVSVLVLLIRSCSCTNVFSLGLAYLVLVSTIKSITYNFLANFLGLLLV